MAMAMALAMDNKMIPVVIRKPVYFNRTISIKKDLVDIAQQKKEALEVNILAKPFNDFIYTIDPFKLEQNSKIWIIKEAKLLNFPISIMDKELKPRNNI